MRLLREILQEQGIHRPLESDVQVRDVAFGERDDVDAGEGETLEETRRVFLVAAEAMQRLGEDDVEPAVQCIPHQRLEPGAKQRRSGDRVVGELLRDCPSLASCELAANARLVRYRSLALVVGGVPRVDRNLHCTVTSGRSGRCAASSPAKSSRAAERVCEPALAAVRRDDRPVSEPAYSAVVVDCAALEIGSYRRDSFEDGPIRSARVRRSASRPSRNCEHPAGFTVRSSPPASQRTERSAVA
jgi:hypothetical protein